jgi:tetratricopeptide (TPR) repeat protein
MPPRSFDPLDEEFFREGDRIGTEPPEDFSDLDVGGSTAALRLPLRAPAERTARRTPQWRRWLHDHAAAIGVAGIIVLLAAGLVAAMTRSTGATVATPAPASFAMPGPSATVVPDSAHAATDPVPALGLDSATVAKKIGTVAEKSGAPARAERPRLTPAQRRQRAQDLYSKGRTASIHGRFAQSASYFQRALKTDSSLVTAHRALGLVYREMGNRKRAAASFRAYLRAAPRARDAATIRRYLQQLSR